jgi:acyl-coenzyme A thioesterase PaaI-like protein
MTLRWYNRNYVKTHFGGSLYAMADPLYMLMLMQILGADYLVWDKGARIEFIKPGRGTVTAEFHIDRDLLEEIATHTKAGRKFVPELSVDIVDSTGELVAKVFKTLYIRRKT